MAIQTRTVTVPIGNPAVGPSLTIENIDLRIYGRNREPLSTAGTGLVVDPGNESVTILGLPDTPGVNYAITLEIDFSRQAIHWPLDVPREYWVIAAGEAGKDFDDFHPVHLVDGDPGATLTITPSEAPGLDYFVEGFTFPAGTSGSLSFHGVQRQKARNWTVSNALVPAGIKPIAQIEREVIMTHLTNRWNRVDLPQVSDPGYGRDSICPIIFYDQDFNPSKPSDVRRLSEYAVEELKGHGFRTLDIADGTWSGQKLPLSLVTTDVAVANPSATPDDVRWILDTGGGPGTGFVVFPQSKVEPGATVTFSVQEAAEPDFTADVEATNLQGVGFLVVNLAEVRAEAADVGSVGSKVAHINVRIMIAAARASAPKTPEVYAGALASIFREVRWVSDPGAAQPSLLRDMADSSISIIRQWRQDVLSERANRLSEHSGWIWFLFQFTLRRQYRPAIAGNQVP